jgi:hypothetical protein
LEGGPVSTFPVFTPARDSAPTVQASGSATGPAANATIVSITIPTPTMSNSELWEISCQYYLSGTVTAADGNNMRISQTPSGGAMVVVLGPLLVAPSSSVYFDQTISVIVRAAAADVISVQAIGAAGVACVYSASLIARSVS